MERCTRGIALEVAVRDCVCAVDTRLGLGSSSVRCRSEPKRYTHRITDASDACTAVRLTTVALLAVTLEAATIWKAKSRNCAVEASALLSIVETKLSAKSVERQASTVTFSIAYADDLTTFLAVTAIDETRASWPDSSLMSATVVGCGNTAFFPATRAPRTTVEVVENATAARVKLLRGATAVTSVNDVERVLARRSASVLAPVNSLLEPT